MKRLLVLFSTVYLFLLTTTLVIAQEKSTLIAPGYPGNDQLTGETHNYSLILKGNGNSVVLGRLSFSNSDSQEIDQYQLEILNTQVDNLVAFQEISKPVCTRYKPITTPSGEPECLTYEIPRYPDPYNADYKKLEVTKEGDKYTFKLNEKVKEASSSGLVFSYNSINYTIKALAKFNFKFETPKTLRPIQNLNLSIDTDNKSLHLQVDDEKVNYGQSEGVKTESLAADEARLVAPTIGTGGRIYKSVSSLTPGETVVITGSYSSSIWALYLDKILWFIGVLLGLLVICFLLIRANFWTKIWSYFQKLSPNQGHQVVILDLVLSLISSSLVFGTILLLSSLLGSGGVYQFLPVPTGLGAALTLLVSLLAFVFVLIILALPSLVLGFKFGWKHTLFYILFEFMWLGVMVVGFAIIFAQFGNYGGYPLFSPALEKGFETFDGPVQID